MSDRVREDFYGRGFAPNPMSEVSRRGRGGFQPPTAEASAATASAQADTFLAQMAEAQGGQITILNEEILTALAVLREYDTGKYNEWTGKMATGISTQNPSSPASQSDIDQTVSALFGPSPSSGDQAAQAPTGGSQSGLFGFPPIPPPPPEESQSRVAAPEPYLGGVSTVPGQTNPLSGKYGYRQSAGFYRYEDQFQFQSKGPVAIRKLQVELERAGLLKKGTYTPGFWDQPSADAMAGAMGYANRGGTTWQSVVDQLKLMPQPAAEKATFVPPPKLMPDPASLNQSVKARFRQALGREPSEGELNQYARQLSGLYSAQQDQEIAEARIAFEQQQALDEGGGATPLVSPLSGKYQYRQVGGGETPAVLGPRTVQVIDPQARFAEVFDQRYGPEIRRNDRVEDLEGSRVNVMQSLLTMQGLVG